MRLIVVFDSRPPFAIEIDRVGREIGKAAVRCINFIEVNYQRVQGSLSFGSLRHFFAKQVEKLLQPHYRPVQVAISIEPISYYIDHNANDYDLAKSLAEPLQMRIVIISN